MSPYHIFEPQNESFLIYSSPWVMFPCLHFSGIDSRCRQMDGPALPWILLVSLSSLLHLSSSTPYRYRFAFVWCTYFCLYIQNIFRHNNFTPTTLEGNLVCSLCTCIHVWVCICLLACVCVGTSAHITQCLLLKTSKESSQESLLLLKLVETVFCWWVFCARYSTIKGQEPLEPFFCLRFSSCFTIINTHLHIWLDLFTCLFI